jgi:hypothetical protein
MTFPIYLGQFPWEKYAFPSPPVFEENLLRAQDDHFPIKRRLRQTRHMKRLRPRV